LYLEPSGLRYDVYQNTFVGYDGQQQECAYLEKNKKITDLGEKRPPTLAVVSHVPQGAMAWCTSGPALAANPALLIRPEIRCRHQLPAIDNQL
jgi:hypothetical protein